MTSWFGIYLSGQQSEGTAPADPNNPDMQPIQGITVDKNTETTAGLVTNGIIRMNKVLREEGISKGALYHVASYLRVVSRITPIG